MYHTDGENLGRRFYAVRKYLEQVEHHIRREILRMHIKFEILRYQNIIYIIKIKVNRYSLKNS